MQKDQLLLKHILFSTLLHPQCVPENFGHFFFCNFLISLVSELQFWAEKGKAIFLVHVSKCETF